MAYDRILSGNRNPNPERRRTSRSLGSEQVGEMEYYRTQRVGGKTWTKTILTTEGRPSSILRPARSLVRLKAERLHY